MEKRAAQVFQTTTFSQLKYYSNVLILDKFVHDKFVHFKY